MQIGLSVGHILLIIFALQILVGGHIKYIPHVILKVSYGKGQQKFGIYRGNCTKVCDSWNTAVGKK